jgi:hypothetical protein
MFRRFYSHITSYGQNKEGKAYRALTSRRLDQIKSLGLSLTEGTSLGREEFFKRVQTVKSAL